MNGGALNAGIDIDLGPLNFAGMVGVTAFNVVGQTEVGPSFTGKLRWLLTPRLYLGGVFTMADASVFQVQNPPRNGIVNPGFVGLSLTVR